MMEFPKALPRRAYSFRLLLNDRHGRRVLAGEWQPSASFTLRLVDDFVGDLNKAGYEVDCIACGEMADDAGGSFGDYWHWNGSAWRQVAGTRDNGERA